VLLYTNSGNMSEIEEDETRATDQRFLFLPTDYLMLYTLQPSHTHIHIRVFELLIVLVEQSETELSMRRLASGFLKAVGIDTSRRRTTRVASSEDDDIGVSK